MENKTATKVLLGLALAIGSAGTTFFATHGSSTVSIPRTVLPMPKENLRPPKEFLNQYHEYLRLQEKAKVLTDNLRPAVPKGYQFDEDTESFKPLPPQPPAVALPPTPAQVPTQGKK